MARRSIANLATVVVAVLVLGLATPAMAQGKAKKTFAVSTDRALVVTRTVLVDGGYDVVRVEQVEGAQVVYYRRGNMGKGKGKGPLMKMVIRRVEDHIVFEETPSDLMVSIELKLRL